MSPAARRTNEPWTCKTLFFFAPALCAGVICDLLCRSEVQTVKNAGCTRRDCSVRRAAGWLFDCVGWVIFPNKQYYFISLLEVRSSTSPRRTHVRTHPILLRRLLRVRVLVQRHLPNLVPHFPIAREQFTTVAIVVVGFACAARWEGRSVSIRRINQIKAAADVVVWWWWWQGFGWLVGLCATTGHFGRGCANGTLSFEPRYLLGF